MRMKSFKFCYSLKSRKTLVATYIVGDGKDIDEAYKDAFSKLCKKHCAIRELYNSVNGDECISMHRASGHEVNFYHA